MPRQSTARTTGTPMPYVEIGSSGINRYGGHIRDEFQLELQGDRGRKTYREMAWNDPIIAAILFVIKMLLRQAPVTVQAGGTSPDDILAHELVETSLADMSLTWPDTLSDILTMLPFGWSFLEVIYKRREGPNESDGAKRSRFNDGLIGWRKWALRSQLSLERWEFDDSGGVQAMVQRRSFGDEQRSKAGQAFGVGVVIPIRKALLFKTENAGGNPEGLPVLRGAYKPYYFSKRIEMLEAIGIERDMAGMPEIRIPGQLMKGTASTDEKAAFEYYKRMGESIRNDNMSCVIIPSDMDSHGHPLYEFSLKSAGGRRQFDTNVVLGRLNMQKAVVVLADFILLGHEQSGSWALSTDKTDLFGTALGAWRDSIYSVINRHEIPRLLSLNGLEVETPPQMVGGPVVAPSLGALGAMLAGLAGAGMPIFPDDGIENAIRARAGLPPKEGSDPITVGKRSNRSKPKVGSAEWFAETETLVGKAGDFDEAEHPRHPEGKSDGGKFAPKSGGGEDDDDAGLADLSQDLTAAEVEAANQYKGFQHVFINGHLRGNLAGELSRTDRAIVESQVASLDRAVAKGTLRADLVAYRGVTDASLVKNWDKAESLVGREVSAPAFVSLSSDPVIAERFAQRSDSVLYEVRVPKGSRVLDIGKHATKLKQYGYESEILIGRNQKMRVVGVGRRGKRPVLKLEVIP